ncbi:MAG: MarR family winged helix-turn-helix transcriptional regulator [Caldimonas sp.]
MAIRERSGADRPVAASDAAVPGSAELSEPAVRVLRRFRLVFNAVRTHFQQVEKNAGVGGTQLWALSVIGANAGIGMSGLAQALDVHQSTASNLVRGLAERELVAVARQGPDRRAVQMRILPAGRRVLKRAPGPFTGVLTQALASLDAATLARIDADLGVLIAQLDADQHDARTPVGSL